MRDRFVLSFDIGSIRYINSEKMFLVLCALLWSQGSIVFCASMLLRYLPVIHWCSDAVIILIHCIAIIGSIQFLQKYIKVGDVLLYIGILLLYIFSMYTGYFENARNYLSENWILILLKCVPVYFVGLGLRKKEQIRFLYFISKLAIITGVMMFFLVRNNTSTFEESAMGFSYSILPHATLVFSEYLENRRRGDLIYGLLGLAIIMAYGERGPLLFAVLFVVVYLVLFKEYRHKIVMKILIILIGIGVFIFLQQIMQTFTVLVEMLGGSSRALLMAINGEYLTGNGREEIYAQGWEYISKRMFKGYGLASDRYLTHQHNTIFPYIHNIVMELWLAFGVIIGSFVFMIFATTIVRGILSSSSLEQRNFLLSLVIGNAFLRLFVSGSYLITPFFFILMGMCVGAIREKKTQKLFRE